MKDFETIKLFCEENSKISSRVIDEFLLYYAAGRNNLEHEMNQKFVAYKHIKKVKSLIADLTDLFSQANYLTHNQLKLTC